MQVRHRSTGGSSPKRPRAPARSGDTSRSLTHPFSVARSPILRSSVGRLNRCLWRRGGGTPRSNSSSRRAWLAGGWRGAPPPKGVGRTGQRHPVGPVTDQVHLAITGQTGPAAWSKRTRPLASTCPGQCGRRLRLIWFERPGAMANPRCAAACFRLDPVGAGSRPSGSRRLIASGGRRQPGCSAVTRRVAMDGIATAQRGRCRDTGAHASSPWRLAASPHSTCSDGRTPTSPPVAKQRRATDERAAPLPRTRSSTRSPDARFRR